jgi:hypothetical protein
MASKQQVAAPTAAKNMRFDPAFIFLSPSGA